MYTSTNMCNFCLLQFPVCGLEEAVSVACIDLKYSVDIYPKKEKDEKTDATTVSFVLDDNIQESEDEIENNAPIKPSDYMDGWID